MSCLQETKFRDITHLANFKFHLQSSFKHHIFVNDPNSHLHLPTRGRSSGVLAIISSDFPGFDSAVDISRLAVLGRYLAVKVLVDGMLTYLHNV